MTDSENLNSITFELYIPRKLYPLMVVLEIIVLSKELVSDRSSLPPFIPKHAPHRFWSLGPLAKVYPQQEKKY